jgi:hypothetical protein
MARISAWGTDGIRLNVIALMVSRIVNHFIMYTSFEKSKELRSVLTTEVILFADGHVKLSANNLGLNGPNKVRIILIL